MSEVKEETKKVVKPRIITREERELNRIDNIFSPAQTIDIINRLKASGLTSEEVTPLLQVVDSPTHRNRRIRNVVNKKDKLGEALRRLLPRQ